VQDGTTVVLGLLHDNLLHIANVGDSRCVLSREVREGKKRRAREGVADLSTLYSNLILTQADMGNNGVGEICEIVGRP
jgi:hypothetical protein